LEGAFILCDLKVCENDYLSCCVGISEYCSYMTDLPEVNGKLRQKWAELKTGERNQYIN